MKSAELAKNIKAAILIASSIRLLVAIVCDQFSTDCAAISLLQKETRVDCIKDGKYYRDTTFIFNEIVVLALFDIGEKEDSLDTS